MKHFDQKAINEISRSYREVDQQIPPVRDDLFGGLFIVLGLILWFLLGYVLVG